MKRLIYFIFIITTAVILTGCSNEIYHLEPNQNIEEEEKVEETTNIDLVGFYCSWRNVAGYDDYIEFKSDGSIFRQVNLSNGYKHYTGSYKIIKQNNKDVVRIDVDEIDSPFYFEIEDDTLIYIEDQNKDNIFMGYYNSSTWEKVNSNEINYWNEFQHDGVDYPEEY